MNRDYKICTRCIMDTSDPEIKFDAEGICNHCKSYYRRVANEVYKGEESKRRLSEIVKKIKGDGRGKEYDCIIGVSGGVDSTTVAYTVKKFDLRPLAVHFDNGWDSELAVDNIKKALDILGIDLYTYVVDWEEFRDLQLSFLRASVANCEIPTDHAIIALLFKMASKFKIKYVISGSNIATEGILPLSWGYYNQDLKHLLAIHRRFGKVPLRTLPKISLKGFLFYVFVKKIRILSILNYVDYKKSKAMKMIEKELGWRYYGSKHFESIYTRFFQGYILPIKFGFDKRRAHLSTLICGGEISREEALIEMGKKPYAGNNLEEDKMYVIKKLGITELEFEQIMNIPVKSYADYPNNAFFLEGLAGFRKIFKKIAKTI
jgi:N-acetyl sugar amidotransferase